MKVFPENYFHIHWFGINIWPEEKDWPEEVPMQQCRCGVLKYNRRPERWYIDTNGNWEYDDAIYEW